MQAYVVVTIRAARASAPEGEKATDTWIKISTGRMEWKKPGVQVKGSRQAGMKGRQELPSKGKR
jgi:hypothetical protein